MNAEERNTRLGSSISADCLLCGNPNPPIEEFDFDTFWVRDRKDWPDYKGGPVHRVCANRRMEAKAPVNVVTMMSYALKDFPLRFRIVAIVFVAFIIGLLFWFR